MSEIIPNATLDLKNLTCPMPVLKIKKHLKTMDSGEILCAIRTDKGTKNNIEKTCEKRVNRLLNIEDENNVFKMYIKKG